MPDVPKEYPVWFSVPGQGANLRMVGPGLHVGSEYAPMEMDWCAVLDLYGAALGVARVYRYGRAEEVVSLPMLDGTAIPEATLNMASDMYKACRGRPFLVHCAAGLSRSASVAYALLRKHHGCVHVRALRRIQTPGCSGFPMEQTLQSARAWAERSTPHS